MTKNSSHDVAPVQEAQATPTPAPDAIPDFVDARDLPPLLQNTDALEALLSKAAGQLR